jgi:NAD(P)-dependent dehydrogenase (short-subunit alcohol dehydrogenase family)
MRGLSGRTAVVTGGATLIGQAVVRAFPEAGANVAVDDIDEAAGALTAGLGAQGLLVNTDLRSDEQIDTFASRTVECFGGIDILVNLACSYVDAGFASSRADWLESYGVKGGIYLAQVGLRVVRQGRSTAGGAGERAGSAGRRPVGRGLAIRLR